jgi:pSer/pThr/pTyr-binding forkhead associated (FHA) protein
LQEENKRREIKAERDKEFMQLMKMSAVSPSFDCIAHGSSFIYPINKPELVVGRGIDCELYLNYPTVSKRHCKVSFTGTSFVLQDLGSSNGTTVNNKTIQRITLKHGDVVRLGEVILNFRM